MAQSWPEDRRKALCAWLTANGINPNHVPRDADLYIEPAENGDLYNGRYLHYEAFHLNASGHPHADERGLNAAIERRRTPLRVDPPDWWEPYRKPTRDQLLDVLDRVKALADEEGEANTYIERARLRAILDLAYETEGLKP